MAKANQKLEYAVQGMGILGTFYVNNMGKEVCCFADSSTSCGDYNSCIKIARFLNQQAKEKKLNITYEVVDK